MRTTPCVCASAFPFPDLRFEIDGHVREVVFANGKVVQVVRDTLDFLPSLGPVDIRAVGRTEKDP